MRRALKEILNSLGDVEFQELLNCLKVADYAKSVMKKYDITTEQLAQEVDMSTEKIFNYLMGTHRYDIYTITKIDFALRSLAKPDIDSIKIKGDE